MKSEPDFVHALACGAHPTDDPVTPHPVILADIDQQTCEMEEARAAALVSGAGYLVFGAE